MTKEIQEPFTLTERLMDQRGVSVRAILIGLLVVCGEVTVIGFSEPVARASSMNISHFPVGFFMWFAGVVLILNPFLKWKYPGYGLSPTELLTVAVVGLIGGHIPGSGLLGFFLGTLSAPFYFASTENRWEDILHPNIPFWLAPSDDAGALTGFFEGVSSGYVIPWASWVIPLFWWGSLIGAFSFALLCIAVIFRKQWVENERLVYPLISPVADLISSSEDSEGIMPDVARTRLFWLGIALGFGGLAWNMIGYFWEGWPRIQFYGQWWHFLDNFPRMTSRLNLYIIGFGYFANVDVLFSLWFFYLFFWVQNGIFNRIGLDLGPGGGGATVWESTGGLFAFVVWGLWVARGHLRDVIRKSINFDCGVDDTGEMLSYRTAVFGLFLGTAFSVLWLWASGMGAGVAVLLILFTYTIYLGLTKVVSESGLLYLTWTVSPQSLVKGLLGLRMLSPSSLTSMAFNNGLSAHGKGIFLSGFAQGTKMANLAKGNRRRMALGMGLSLAVGIPLCLYLNLKWGYEYGAYNFGGTPFKSGQHTFQRAAGEILGPEGVAYGRLMVFGIGAVMMSVLTILRYRLRSWPLNPIGLACYGRATKSVFSVFLVWGFKYLILRIGGVTLYRRFRPVFVGLLSGYSLGVGLSFLIDVIWFQGQGHWIHLY